MTEVKYRVWTGKKMIYVASPQNDTTLHIYEGGWSVSDHFTGTHIELCNNKNGFLMQFTGSKDKYDKDIYKSDIVINENRTWEEEDGEEPTYSNEVSSIIYRTGGFWVKDEGFGWEGEDLWDWSQIKVIGNIYENPELLKSIS